MDGDSYVQSGETIYCRTETRQPDSTEGGELLVTDTRLIYIRSSYFNDNKALGVNLNRIDEVEYHQNPIKWGYVAFAALIALVGVFGWLITPDVEFIPDYLQLIIPLLGLFLGILSLFDVWNARTETLIVRTPSNTHEFRGGNLQDFPHAIHGNTV